MNAGEENNQLVLLVGSDGSPTARAAVDYAAGRAGRQGKLYIVHGKARRMSPDELPRGYHEAVL